MLVYTYDGSFEGFLTLVFESYRRKSFPGEIHSAGKQPENLFSETVHIMPDAVKAGRVWKSLQKNLSARNRQIFYHAFLSEEKGIEMKILQFARRIFDEKVNIETDFGDPVVLEIFQYARKVKREAHRVLQFARFQQTKDGLYFCGIEPMYDVLPLTLKHFKTRFAGQNWLLYDLKRNYGAFYDGKMVEEVVLTNDEINRNTGQLSENVLNESDAFYQNAWKSYFENINIKERKNLRLQRQFMPRRFWKYLTEKQ